jgi:hypothetical protein
VVGVASDEAALDAGLPSNMIALTEIRGGGNGIDENVRKLEVAADVTRRS